MREFGLKCVRKIDSGSCITIRATPDNSLRQFQFRACQFQIHPNSTIGPEKHGGGFWQCVLLLGVLKNEFSTKEERGFWQCGLRDVSLEHTHCCKSFIFVKLNYKNKNTYSGFALPKPPQETFLPFFVVLCWHFGQFSHVAPPNRGG